MPFNYELLTRQSRFVVKVKAKGMLSALGHNPTLAIRRFTGTLDFEPDSGRVSAFEMSVEAGSLEVIDDFKRSDREEIERRTRAEVLESVKYPEIRYHCAEISSTIVSDSEVRLQMNGTLRLRGVDQPQVATAQWTDWQDEAKLSGSLTISQKKFGIKPVSAVGGTITLDDELKLEYRINARRCGECRREQERVESGK